MNIEKSENFPQIKGKKRKMAELLVDPDCDLNVTEMCKTIGVSRTAFYKWQKDKNFKEYVKYLIESYADSELANIWKALIKKAKVGDLPAQKLYFELKEKYKQKIEVEGNVIVFSGENEIEK